MMTENEAKTKWCPMARFQGGNDKSAFNRFHGFMRDGLPGLLCIGSDCMAWRAVPEQFERKRTSAGKLPDGDGWKADLDADPKDGGIWWKRSIAPAGGYCGAFGEPSN